MSSGRQAAHKRLGRWNIIQKVLAANGGDITAAAKELSMGRYTVYRYLTEFGGGVRPIKRRVPKVESK